MDKEKNIEWLEKCVRGKSVAIVGNADSIKGTRQAERIESCDTVIRFSWAFLFPFPPEDAGSRTDVWAMHERAYESSEDAMKEEEKRKRVMFSRDNVRAVGWYRPTKKDGFLFRTNPTLGPVVIWSAIQKGACALYLCGMDFFKTCDPAVQNNRGIPIDVRTSRRGFCHNHEMDRAFMRSMTEKQTIPIETDVVLAESLRE